MNEPIDPRTLVGKFLAYDSPNDSDANMSGAVFAEIESVVHNKIRGWLLITKCYIVRTNISVRKYTDSRCFYWDAIKDLNLQILDKTSLEKMDSNSLDKMKEEILVEMLTSKSVNVENRQSQQSALSLGSREIAKYAGDEELKDIFKMDHAKGL